MVQQATQLMSHQQEEARSAVERIAAFAAEARVNAYRIPVNRERATRNFIQGILVTSPRRV